MKLITLEHKVCDYTCMWNGIQDIYQQKSGEDVPGYLFFCLSGIGNFVYLSFKQGGLRKMVGWGDGRPKKMYPDVCGTIGFSFKCIEGTSFAYCLKTAKAQIDEGKPVVLGCLDMYYLDYYPKMYQKIHVPIHYVLMVGYDDDKQCVYVLDCGKPDMQTLSYACLEQALNVKKSPVGDKNGFYDRLCRAGETVKRYCGFGIFEKSAAYAESARRLCGYSGYAQACPGDRRLARRINAERIP